MAEVVNLRQARKAKKREEDAKTAAENRARFGRSKAAKLKEKTETAKARRDLDGHEREH